MSAIPDMAGILAAGAARQRASFYAWRNSLGIGGRLALALAAAAVIGVSAQISLPLPFTPVPLTLQTFSVASIAVCLGWGWGVLAPILYVGLAGLGLPWLAGLKGGGSAVAGSNGGYLLGFVLMSLALSVFAREPSRCRWFPTWLVLYISDAVLILLPGALWLYAWMRASGTTATWEDAFAKGFFPFVIVDFFKSGAAALVVAWLGRGRAVPADARRRDKGV
ncbi:MAG: biotin transporter BioY [Planctomycetota bacterium]|jgi:biotin transport system substrate-specific component|nr:biotin transporter BioY [Planctomycetota bacterium]